MCEADYKLVAKAIRHRVTTIKRQREKQRRLLEEAVSCQKEAVIEEESDPAPQPPERTNQKPAAATSPSAAGKVCLTQFPWKQGRMGTQCLLLAVLAHELLIHEGHGGPQ